MMGDVRDTAATPARRTIIMWVLGLTVLASAATLAGVGWLLWSRWGAGPDAQTVVAASLQGLREQNVLTPFTARYVAVVTSRQSRLGGVLNAQKTLILPGTVRYDVDLAQLKPADVRWDADQRRLTVTLPPIRLSGPEIDMAGVREYRDGAVLMALTDAEQSLDMANREQGRAALLQQAAGPVPMGLARAAAARAVEQNFAVPLRAAGIDATVRANVAR